MATKKAASTKKKTTAKKTAASKTTVRTVSAEKVEAPKKETAAAKPTTTKRSSVKLPSNIINIIFAELIGTFVLTLVALTTFKDGGVGALALARQPSRNIWFVDYAQAQDNPATILLGRPIHRRYAGCNRHQLGYWRLDQLRL